MAEIISNKENITADFGKCMQNRELSWLRFNDRVLEESNFEANPLLERLKFVSIFNSNLDEFFMIRVGSLTDYMLFAPNYFDNKTGWNAEEQLDAIFEVMPALYVRKDRLFETVTKELSEHGVEYLKMQDLDESEASSVEKDFTRNIQPLLSPLIIDNRHPFPHIDNKRLYVAVTIEHKSRSVFGLIAVPDALDRIYYLEGGFRYLLLEDIIYHFADKAFSPYVVKEKTILAVTRNADLNTEEESALDEEIDYLKFMQKIIKKRQRLAPVRLELGYKIGKDFRTFFCEKLNLKEKQVFISSSPLDLSYCYKLEERSRSEIWESLVWPTHVPANPSDKTGNLIKQVQNNDLMFSFPYESMSPFLDMLRRAADDPEVISIKITMYRLDIQSKLAESLSQAAENGKEVIVLMELRARFDEANNIEWAERLEEVGCHVIYGLPGYKVHSKICLITKKEGKRISYITQIGTGNYNEKTARLYTDLSVVTTDQAIGQDAAEFFQNLLLDNLEGNYNLLWVAPNRFKRQVVEQIEQERNKAERGEDGRILIKCNSLTDRGIILKLIEAAQSGVKIKMIVRGICCLVPGIPGFTENISVISIVGRFLEHSRIFCFGSGNDMNVYISSADLMTRNTERRIEIACPVLNEKYKQRLFSMIETMLSDNVKAWDLLPDGEYVLRKPEDGEAVNSQEFFIAQAAESASTAVTLSAAPGGRAEQKSDTDKNRFARFFSGFKKDK